MGVELTRVVTLRPLGAWSTISSARTVSPGAQPLGQGDSSSRETSRPSARRKVSTSSSCSADSAGRAQVADDPHSPPG